ncbi:MAG: DUF481 domain-containing protein [Psychroserpens sp.]|nr:DUF481 domain-containing protein [Psychroserpens sp.]
MKKIVIGFLFIPVILSAQMNESAKDSLKVKGDLALTGFWQGGNVETLIFRAKSNFTYKPVEKWVFKSKNSFVYQEFGKEKADADILSLNFVYFNPQKKIYPLFLGFLSTNFRREIDVRSLVGAGVSVNVINEKENWLKFSLTSEYEQTNFAESDFNRDDYDGSTDIDTFRATIWISGKYQIIKDKLIFTHENYFQPSLEESDNFRWQSDFGIEIPVWKFLNFKVNYLHTFESIVIEGQEQDDRFLTFGLKLKSY